MIVRSAVLPGCEVKASDSFSRELHWHRTCITLWIKSRATRCGWYNTGCACKRLSSTQSGRALTRPVAAKGNQSPLTALISLFSRKPSQSPNTGFVAYQGAFKRWLVLALHRILPWFDTSQLGENNGITLVLRCAVNIVAFS